MTDCRDGLVVLAVVGEVSINEEVHGSGEAGVRSHDCASSSNQSEQLSACYSISWTGYSERHIGHLNILSG